MAEIGTKEKFTFDVGWIFGSSIIVLLLHFLQKPIMARYLGPDGLGLFSMTTMLMGIAELVLLLGIDGALIKFVAEHKESEEKVSSLTSSAFVTASIIGVVSSLALFLLSDAFASIFEMPLLSSLIRIYSIIFTFSLVSGIITSFLSGLREMRYNAFLKVIRASFGLIFIVALLMVGLGPEGAIIGTSLAIFAEVSIGLFFVSKFTRFNISGYKENTKTLASFGSRLVGVNMIGQIYQYVDVMMIGYFLNATEVGYYSVAISFSRFFWLVPRAVASVAYPAISEYWAKENINAINKLVDKATKYTACLLTFGGIAIVLFSKDVITLLFTSEFLPAVIPLGILTFGTVISGIFRSIGGIFAGIEKVDLALKISAVGSVLAILLNLFLIPTLGLIGAAVATTSVYILDASLTLYYLKSSISLRFDNMWYLKMLLIMGVTAAIYYVLGFFNHYIASVIAIIFYVAATIRVLLTGEDIDFFINIANKVLKGDFLRR
ncbi:MAG: flippase [Halobacteriota archaeon]|nr:flippase [Halobacteriota archaeon]